MMVFREVLIFQACNDDWLFLITIVSVFCMIYWERLELESSKMYLAQKFTNILITWMRWWGHGMLTLTQSCSLVVDLHYLLCILHMIICKITSVESLNLYAGVCLNLYLWWVNVDAFQGCWPSLHTWMEVLYYTSRTLLHVYLS